MITREPMLDMFLFETEEMIEQLQQLMIESEKEKEIGTASINEIFRIMHTIKGSSGMMMFDNISHLSHSIEDMFYFIRENKPEHIDYSVLADLVLEGSDLIKEEADRIGNGKDANTDFSDCVERIERYVELLKAENGFAADNAKSSQGKEIPPVARFYVTNDKSSSNANCFSAALFFEEKCEMENIRSFTVLHKLKEIADVVHFEPEDILENNESTEVIRQQGFLMYFKTAKTQKEIDDFLQETIFLDHLELVEYADEKAMMSQFQTEKPSIPAAIIHEIADIQSDNENIASKSGNKANIISVDVNKLDKLMDLVGELVISESMVTNNHELKGLELDDFYKAVRQHRKRISDLQDVVMSIRMVPLAPTLSKMNRIVRDMCKKLDKKVELTILGEDTEVDKNIIEHIGDPLMHIVRNSMDHGIEGREERIAQGKNPVGNIMIETKNAGGDVLIIIKDDGKGLDRDKILQKAIENGVVEGDGQHLSDKEIYATIFSPGLSTNEKVTEFSGRGVGMDVVVKEIEKVRGSVTVDSMKEMGTTITIKIPLTIAILDGMIVRVGESLFTIPVTSIKQSIIVKNEEVFRDLDHREMLTIRGECFAIMRLHELYKLKTDIKEIEDGIIIMLEDDGKTICLFADELIGEQQVVIKALPEYISRIKGTSGCTLLGNGYISLILDVSQLVNM